MQAAHRQTRSCLCGFNTSRPRQSGRHFPDDSFKWIFLNENVWISIEVSLKFSPKGPINNIPALVQIMAWSRPGNKPLSEPMMVSLLTHICVTRPQWFKVSSNYWSARILGLWRIICKHSLDINGLYYRFNFPCQKSVDKMPWCMYHQKLIPDLYSREIRRIYISCLRKYITTELCYSYLYMQALLTVASCWP